MAPALGVRQMLCHECARVGRPEPAVGACRFCSVGLCKPHLVASFESEIQPQYACDHHPDRPFETMRTPAERPLAMTSL